MFSPPFEETLDLTLEEAFPFPKPFLATCYILKNSNTRVNTFFICRSSLFMDYRYLLVNKSGGWVVKEGASAGKEDLMSLHLPSAKGERERRGRRQGSCL